MSFTPQYQISDKLLNLVAQAEAAKQLIDNSLLVPYWERKFKNEALIRTVHHSTAIEGNQLDFEQTQKVMEGEDVNTIRVRDIKEIINYRDAIGFISATNKKVITISFLNQIHKILGANILSEKYLGKFRTQKAVIVNSQTGEIVFDAPGPLLIEGELQEMIEWDENSNQIHPILKAGIIHYELVRIHPFVDLNGRSARTLTTWSLYRDGYDIKRFFSLEEYYDQDLPSYYDALDSANEGDMTNWLEYFVLGLQIELERVKQLVLKLSKEKKLILKLGQLSLNERQIELVSYLEDKTQLQNSQFDTVFPQISDDTILRDLRDLIDKGLVIKKGKTKAARYLLA